MSNAMARLQCQCHVNNCVCSVNQSCLTLCNPMDCGLPGSSDHRVFQSRIGLPFPPPGDFSDPGIQSTSPASVDEFFTTGQPGKPN